MNRHILSLSVAMMAMVSVLSVAVVQDVQAQSALESRPFEAFKGRPAPNLVIEDGRGQQVPLVSFKGKVTIVNLWATWCPPCVQELPALQQLRRELYNDGLEVIIVSQDIEGFQKIVPFLEESRIELPSYIDPDTTLYRALAVRGLPTTYILNRRGEFVARIEGATNWLSHDTITYLKALLQAG